MTEPQVVGVSGAVREALEALARPDGSLLASEVLDAARSPKSALHGEFEWDDTEAAEAYRRAQAAGLIRSYKIKITAETATGEVRDVIVRGYVSAKRSGQENAEPGSYVPTAGLPPLAQKILLRRMQRDIASLQAKYANYPEFWALISGLGEGNAAASG